MPRPQLQPKLNYKKRTRIQLGYRLGLLVLFAASFTAQAQDSQEKADSAPASAQWSILFRADNPAVWNTNAKGPDGVPIALPLSSAPAQFRYLRLRRMDTREALIVVVTPDQLQNAKPTAPETGFWWSGGNKEEWKGRHLGIAHGPRYKFPMPEDMIAVMMDGWEGFAGSGFGHKCFVNDGQYYCWLGKQIKKTAFEIAVSDGPLGPDERRVLVGPKTKTPPLAVVHAERPASSPKSVKPSAKTAKTAKLSREKFEQVQTGMTEKEVLDILGPAHGSSTKTVTSNDQTNNLKSLMWAQVDPNMTIVVKFWNWRVSDKNCIQVDPVKK
jgi:hypothetical protein